MLLTSRRRTSSCACVSTIGPVCDVQDASQPRSVAYRPYDLLRSLRVLNDLWRGSLGVLEREVMDAVWTAGDVTVRDTRSLLPRRVAYTTVMTTLDRLFKKGLVVRSRVGKAFVYRAARTRQQTQAAILSNLVDSVGSDNDVLDTLEQLVRERKRRLGKAEDAER
jgi:predicted transcriptional regulator